jgi:hypothetical protein
MSHVLENLGCNENYSAEGSTLQSAIMKRLIKRNSHAISNLRMRKDGFDNYQRRATQRKAVSNIRDS